jgi:hypothetical protein
MLFKRKLSASSYLQTRLDLLFSQEQAELWLQARKLCGDSALLSLRDDLYLMHLRAAHIQLLLMVLTKKYFKNNELIFTIESYVEDYLDESDGWFIKSLLSKYSHALGSGYDGVLSMTRAVLDDLCGSLNEPETLIGFRALFYDSVCAFRSDIKAVRLVADLEPN